MPGVGRTLAGHGPGSLLPELYRTILSGFTRFKGWQISGLTARPHGSIDLGVGAYPPGMCGSSAFDDTLRILGENPALIMANSGRTSCLYPSARLRRISRGRMMTHFRPAQLRPTDLLQAFDLTGACTTLVRGLGLSPAAGIARYDHDSDRPG